MGKVKRTTYRVGLLTLYLYLILYQLVHFEVCVISEVQHGTNLNSISIHVEENCAYHTC